MPPTPQQLTDWDRAHSWHPFTHMRQYLESDPVIVERGEGVRVRDVQGRWYYDGVSSIWLNVHGHCVPAIDDAVRGQLERIAHATMLGQATVPATMLAKRLCEVAPAGLSRVHFADAGANAVEIAVKTAIQYWWNLGQPAKREVLGFTDNYHGDTLGAMAVAPSEVFHKPFLDLLPVNPRLPYPVCADQPLVRPEDQCDPAHVEAIDAHLAAHAATTAAVIVEPVEGAGGMRPAPPGFLRALRESCDRHDVLLIVDEVATGFGHTGALFACSAEDVTPDLLCLGKGLTGGYLPLSATMTTARVFDAFLGDVRDQRTLFHGHSFAGNPLACAAALASLDLLEPLLPELPARVRTLADALAPLTDAPFVAAIRQRGFMVGIDLAPPGDDAAAFDWWSLPGMIVAEAAREAGLLIRPIGSVVILMPAPAATPEELREMVRLLHAALRAAAPRLEALVLSGASA